MTTPIFVKGKPVNLKTDSRFNETWVKDRIKEDLPALGLGNLEVKVVERPQKGGFLDLLLVDEDEDRWFEVEVQLGPTDPSHIIRTIEYWDYEQRHFPNHKHCAVLVAEDITTRFLNVISLFNRQIPIMAIQMKAIEVEGKVILDFTRVLDTEETEEDEAIATVDSPTSASDWEKRSSELAVKLVKECADILKEVNPEISEAYKSVFVGLTVSGKANNFIVFYPKKQFVTVHVRSKKREEWAGRLRGADGIQVLSTGSKSIRFRLTQEGVDKNRDLLKQLFSDGYEENKE
jgi:hypothetical protein